MLLMQELELDVVSQSYAQVTKLSRRAALSIEKDYEKFFAEMENIIGSIEVPAALTRYLPDGEWDLLTKAWMETKEKYNGEGSGAEHFLGITGADIHGGRGWLSRRKSSPGMSRNKYASKAPAGSPTLQPFSNYILSLARGKSSERFFGPVTIRYDFQEIDPSVRITTKMGPLSPEDAEIHKNEIRKILVRNVKTGKWAKAPSELRVTASIEAFRALEMVKRTEFDIVDYFIKQVDHKNEKQWVKLNGRTGWAGKEGGRGRGHRPIRALVQPLIQYYINDALPEDMQNAYRSS